MSDDKLPAHRFARWLTDPENRTVLTITGSALGILLVALLLPWP